MNELKKILVCALGLTAAFTVGCDVEPDCNEAGICDAGAGATGGEPEPSAEPEPEPGDVVYDTVIIFDDGSMDDGAGTSGVDICDVSADCATAVSATPILGGGELCSAEGPGCSTNRTDPNAAIDGGSACEAASVPSDYISLGTDGQLAVTFDGDLTTCNVTVVEFAGATQEAYEVYVCDDTDVGSATCLANDLPVHSAAAGGEATFAVPAE